jgi:hypothetical protein
MAVDIIDNLRLGTDLPLDSRYVVDSIYDVSMYWYDGMQVFQTDNNTLQWYDGSIWNTVTDASTIQEFINSIDSSIIELYQITNNLESSIGDLDILTQLHESSLGDLTQWNISQDASIDNLRGRLDIVDGSIVDLTQWNISQDASIDNLRGRLDIVDGSIVYLTDWNTSQDASIVRVDASLNALWSWNEAQDASIEALQAKDASIDASLNALWNWNETQDASIDNLRDRLDIVDGSITYLTEWNISQDASITELQNWNEIQDVSIEFATKVASFGTGTGLVSGGAVTINSGDNTTFDISAGTLFFIDQYTDPENPVIEEIIYPGAIGITPTYLNTHQATYISLDRDGSIIQTTNKLTPRDRREFIHLAIAIHNNFTNIGSIQQDTISATDILHATYDLFDTLSMVKFDDGNKLYPITASLSFRKTAGTIFKRGSDYANDIQNPNFKIIPEANPAEFYYRTVDGSTDSTARTEVILDEYEITNGIDSSIVKITDPTKASVQRVHLMQSGKILIQRGQAVYDTVEQAVSQFLDEDFQTEFNISNDGLLIGCIAAIQACPDLSNRSKATFVSVDRYGSILGATNAGFYSLVNRVNVRSIEDLPCPSSGIIYLQNSFTYNINGNIHLGSNILSLGANVVIQGENPSNDIIIGNTPNAVFNGIDKSALFEFVGLMNIGDGSIFDLAGGPTSQLAVQNCYILGQPNLGAISGYGFLLLETVFIPNMGSGLVIGGGDSSVNAADVFINQLLVREPTTSALTMITIDEGYFHTFKIWDSNVFLANGNTFLYADPSITSYELDTFHTGLLFGNEFTIIQDASILSGVSKRDDEWIVKNNRGIADSAVLGFVEFIDNATATTIGNTATYYKAAGTNSGNTQGERMDVATNNRIQYTGLVTPTIAGRLLISGSVYVANNNQSILVAVFKNGTTKIGENAVFLPRSGEPTGFAVNLVDDITSGDYYEVFVRNLTAANNITVEFMQFRISGEL